MAVLLICIGAIVEPTDSGEELIESEQSDYDMQTEPKRKRLSGEPSGSKNALQQLNELMPRLEYNSSMLSMLQ